jgi:hypothetical protein
MVKKAVRRPAKRSSVTIGDIVEHVKMIEEQCRILRMLLQRLDKTIEVKLTAQLKSAIKVQSTRTIPSAIC